MSNSVNISKSKVASKKATALRRLTRYGVLATVAPLVLASTGSLVHGEDKEANETSFVLEEITVTARKRAESLQDAPISMAAFSGADLDKRNASDLSSIDAFTPNLVFDAAAPISGSNVAASIFIRGIGQTDFAFTTDPGVGLYLDGVYLARSIGGVLDLVDLERVEVLRGPQGTLFGRNTIGGAISLVSKKPGEEFGGYINVTVGSDSRIDVKASVDVPLSDTLFSKISISSKNRDGYVTRLSDGVKLGDDDSQSVRVSLLWNASENLTVNFAMDGSIAREETAPNTLIDINGAAMPFSFLFNNVIVGGSCAPAPGDVNNPNCYNSQWVTDSIYETNASSPSRSDYDVLGGVLTLDYDADWVSIKSITAYRDMKTTFYRDADHSPHVIFETSNEMEHQQFSQEFQFSGTALDDRLTWLAGLYYFNETGSDINDIMTSIIEFQSGGKIKNDSKAVFSQATYDVTNALSVTAGLRYSSENKRFTPDTFVTDSGFLGVPVGTRLLPHEESAFSIDKVNPMVNVAYKFNDDVMAYTSYSEGFKSGGFTQRIFPGRAVTPSFRPEFAKSYEVGMKTTSLDGRLRVNVALFKTDYSDMQVVVQDGIGSSNQNAAAAELKGFELEFKALLAENMGIEGGIGYLDSNYTEVSANATEITLDKHLVNAPEWSVNGSAYVDFSTDYGMLTPRVNWSYRSKVYNNAINSENIIQDGYHLVDMSLTFEDNEGAWLVSASVTNLLKTKYFSSAYNNPAIGYAEALWARPREFSVRLVRNF
ncbi:MAG: TonB-dependent receptor [Alphaproteobacteria bacterium]|nr:MAG: TonB-dependent receptor [Alphaproteobacteria bacterium]